MGFKPILSGRAIALVCFFFEFTGLLPHGQASLTSAEKENKAQPQLVFPGVPSLNLENCVKYYNYRNDVRASQSTGFFNYERSHTCERFMYKSRLKVDS
ncbi:hypothetical protein [Microcoleus sp. PH2017_30_WIL_O_A]|uniref:hypothetical protein n=1 Tax=Microcoleus sp. PH2017_30_WIL_O_A TaxID=2798840 RepID=UPI0025F01263|nr:hypothetical protein [Microcoleus sp. PH2017_30_WIL_O_A]